MPNAIEELEAQRELQSLTPQQRAAILLASLDKETSGEVCTHLNSVEIGHLFLELGLLPSISDGARRRVFCEFGTRLKRALRDRQGDREDV